MLVKTRNPFHGSLKCTHEIASASIIDNLQDACAHSDIFPISILKWKPHNLCSMTPCQFPLTKPRIHTCLLTVHESATIRCSPYLVYLVGFPDNESLGRVLCSSRMSIQYDIINIYEIFNEEKCHRIRWFSNNRKTKEAVIEMWVMAEWVWPMLPCQSEGNQRQGLFSPEIRCQGGCNIHENKCESQ